MGRLRVVMEGGILLSLGVLKGKRRDGNAALQIWEIHL